MGQTVQGNVVIKRLRTGHTLALGLRSTGADLYQTVDSNGNVLPKWTPTGSHPVIVPYGRSLTAGKTGKLSDWTWKYLGNPLSFNASGACTTSGYESKFKVDKATGKLEIIGDLASKDNIDNDTLTFTAKVTVDTVSAVIDKDIEVVIAAGGASSYRGNIRPADVILDASTPSTSLTTELWLGGEPVTNFTVKWYKTVKDPAHALTNFNPAKVTRADVDGTTLFIADFIVGGSVVYTDGVILTDQADEYTVVCGTSDAGGIADTGDVTVTGTLTDTRTNTKAALTNCTWKAFLYKITGEDNGDGQLNFENGQLQATDISGRNTSTDKMICLVKVNATDSGDSDIVVVFEATFEI